MRKLQKIQNGYAFKSDLLTDALINSNYLPVIKIGNVNKLGFLDLEGVTYHQYDNTLKPFIVSKGDILVAMTGATVGKVAVSDFDNLLLNQRVGMIKEIKSEVDKNYLRIHLQSELFYNYCQQTAGGGAQGNISPTEILEYEIPLPPLEVQREIVAEIEGWQKIIDGARQVVENYKPTIRIKPEWEMVELGSVCEMVQYGLSEKLNTNGDGYRVFRMNELIEGIAVDNGAMKRAPLSNKEFEKYKLRKGDILFNRTNSIEHVGRTGIFNLTGDYCFASYLIRLRINESKANPFYVNLFMNTDSFQQGIKNFASRAVGQSNINAQSLSHYKIPLPSFEEQSEIVASIEREQQLVNSNKEVIHIFERKIKDRIAEVWGAKPQAKEYRLPEERPLSMAAEE